MILGGRDAVRELAVVGEQQQPFAVIIEATHRVDTLAHALHQIEHRRPALGIAGSGDVAGGLVQNEIYLAIRKANQLAIHFDVVSRGVRFASQLNSHLAVDGDPALDHELFSFAAAGDTGVGQQLLQPLFGHVRD